jgi:hypothetical protein
MKKDQKSFHTNSRNIDDEKDNESLNPNAWPILMKKDYRSFHTNSENVDDKETTIV